MPLHECGARTRSLHAEPEASSFQSAQEQAARARPPERAIARRMSELSRDETAPPGLPPLRLLQGAGSDGHFGLSGRACPALTLSPAGAQMITIAVDAIGGDHAPRPEVEGAVLAATCTELSFFRRKAFMGASFMVITSLAGASSMGRPRWGCRAG